MKLSEYPSRVGRGRGERETGKWPVGRTGGGEGWLKERVLTRRHFPEVCPGAEGQGGDLGKRVGPTQ